MYLAAPGFMIRIHDPDSFSWKGMVRKSIGALLIGLLVAGGGSLGTTGLLSRFEPSVEALQVLRPAAGWVLLNLAYTTLFAVLGGFVMVRTVRREAFRHALMLGIVLMVAVVGWWGMAPLLYRPPFWYQVALVMLLVPATTLGGALGAVTPLPPQTALPPTRPATVRPVVERPVVERPVVERPVVERPVVERPVFRSLAEL